MRTTEHVLFPAAELYGQNVPLRRTNRPDAPEV